MAPPPLGSDKNSGLTPDQPLATLSAAQQHARSAPLAAVKTIYCREGIYRMRSVLTLAQADSNTHFRRYPGDSDPVYISGAAAVSGWTRVPGSPLWSASVPPGVGPITQLFIDDRRMIRARVPNANGAGRGLINSTFTWERPLAPCDSGSCPPVDSLGVVFQNDDLQSNWTDLQHVELLFFHSWFVC